MEVKFAILQPWHFLKTITICQPGQLPLAGDVKITNSATECKTD